MTRPNHITQTDLDRWTNLLEIDNSIPEYMKKFSLLKEVCFAGFYLVEQLQMLKCPENVITNIQYCAGKASFGKDPWIIHSEFLKQYQNKTLIIDEI